MKKVFMFCIVAILFTACGVGKGEGGGEQPAGIENIIAWAQNNGNNGVAPTQGDYNNTGVDLKNISIGNLNTYIAMLNSSQVDSKDEIQFIIDNAGALLIDTDNDGIPNGIDTDDDNDGVSDVDELAAGTDPLVADSNLSTFTIGDISDSTVEENNAYVGPTPTISGDTPVGTLAYTLSGADATQFAIASSTGVVSMVARDFENPTDGNTDNVYEVTITATDSSGSSDSESWMVRVTNVADSSGQVTIPPGEKNLGDVWLELNNSAISSGESFDIEVYVHTGSKMLGAFNVYFDFNSADIEVDLTVGDVETDTNKGLSKGADTSNYLMMLNASDVTNGHYRFAGINAGASNTYASGIKAHIATIHVKATRELNTETLNLALRTNELSDELGRGL